VRILKELGVCFGDVRIWRWVYTPTF